jgi:hypothetical protein
VRDKSAAENNSRNLMEKLSAAEAEKEDLGHRLAPEKEDADKACVEAQATRADAKLARAEANLALQRAAEASHRSIHGYLEKAEASTRTEVDRARALLVDVYRQLGARTAPLMRPVRRWASAFLDGCRRNWRCFRRL